MFDNINNQPAQAPNNQNGYDNPPSAGGGSNPAANSQIPNAAPRGITDMYAEVDRPEKPDAFRPKQEINQFDQADQNLDGIPPEMFDNGTGTKQKIINLLMVIIGMAILGAGGYYGFRFYKNNFAPGANNLTPDESAENASTTKTDEDATNEPAEVPPSTQPDDQAGTPDDIPPLIDESSSTPENPATTTEETPLDGIDTDQDGLTDVEEATLGTSPTNVDSDIDGLSDRQEARVYKTNPINPDSDGDGYNDGDEVGKGYNPNGPGKLYDINDIE